MRVCDKCGAKHGVRLVVAMGAWEQFTPPPLANVDLCKLCAVELRVTMEKFLPNHGDPVLISGLPGATLTKIQTGLQ